MKILKTYKETQPEVKLIGKRYTNEDRDASGTFGRYWAQCFEEDWPALLGQCKRIPGVSDDLVGAMRMTGDSGSFEYWVGAFLAPDAEAPDGFESVIIPAGEVAVCWLRGNDKNGEIYSQEASDLAMAAMAEKGWTFSEKRWFFERYNCPRFTEPDENGEVILDICAFLD